MKIDPSILWKEDFATYQEYITYLITARPKSYIKVLRNKKQNSLIMEEILKCTGNSVAEKLHYFMGSVIGICKNCNIAHTKFQKAAKCFYDYCRPCSLKIASAKAAITMKENKDENGISVNEKRIAKGRKTKHETLDINNKNIYQLSSEKAAITKTEDIDEFGANGHDRGSAKIVAKMSIIGEDNLTTYQRSGPKMVATKAADLDEFGNNGNFRGAWKARDTSFSRIINGLNGFQRGAIKARITRYADVDEFNRNSYQRGHTKGLLRMKTTFDDLGFSTWEKLIRKSRASRLKEDENGISPAKRGAAVRNITCLNKIVDGLNVFKMNARKAKKTKLEDIVGGLNNFQRTARNMREKSRIPDENGITGFQRIGKKVALARRKMYAALKHPDLDKLAYVYVLHDKVENLIKIGWSTCIEKRVKGIEKSFNIIGKDLKFDILYGVSGRYQKILNLETSMHNKFKSFNFVRDQQTSGRTEWFRDECKDEVLIAFSELSAEYFTQSH